MCRKFILGREITCQLYKAGTDYSKSVLIFELFISSVSLDVCNETWNIFFMMSTHLALATLLF